MVNHVETSVGWSITKDSEEIDSFLKLHFRGKIDPVDMWLSPTEALALTKQLCGALLELERMLIAGGFVPTTLTVDDLEEEPTVGETHQQWVARLEREARRGLRQEEEEGKTLAGVSYDEIEQYEEEMEAYYSNLDRLPS